jgi:hypothetical protein
MGCGFSETPSRLGADCYSFKTKPYESTSGENLGRTPSGKSERFHSPIGNKRKIAFGETDPLNKKKPAAGISRDGPRLT